MSIDLSVLNDLGLTSVETPQPKKKELGQEEFLKLMTTQLTNQNPLKPMENGDFLAQMAQFGTVSGIQELQESFREFSSTISSDQALQAAGLVGRQVLAPGDEALLAAGGEVRGVLELPSGSTSVKVKIIDSMTGEIVRNLDLGSKPAGETDFVWDGVGNDGLFADPGLYKVQAEAMIGGASMGLATQIESTVKSVTMSNGQHGLLINLAGLDSVEFNQIKQIL
ncbi:MAG: flagellar hook assembly protein FlgD [Gammaproteobacteria bacterium]